MKETEEKLINVLSKHKDIESFNVSIGSSSSTIASNEGRFFVVLKPIGERKDVQSVIKELRTAIRSVANIKVSMQAVQNLRIGGSLSKSQYQYTIQTQETGEKRRRIS